MAWQTIASHTSRGSIPLIGVSIKAARGNNPANPVTDEQNIAMAVEVGAKLVRKDIMWADVETSPGVYNWAATKAFVDKAWAKGLQCLLILARNNPLYTGSWDLPPVTPAARVAYKNFVVSAAQTLGAGFYEIQNEPNNSQMWGGPVDPEAYGLLLNEVLTGIQAARPQTPIIAGGMAIGGPSGPGGFMAPADFIAAAMPFISVTNLRAWGMHPYTGADQYLSDPMMRAENVQARMLSLRPAGVSKMVFNTEQGFSVPHCAGATFADRQRRQATFAQRFVLSALTCWQMAVWYDLVDDGTDTEEVEHNFGLYDFRLDIKPSGIAFKAVTGLLNACQSAIVQRDGDLYRVVFTMPDGQRPSIIWSAAGEVRYPVQEQMAPIHVLGNVS